MEWSDDGWATWQRSRRRSTDGYAWLRPLEWTEGTGTGTCQLSSLLCPPLQSSQVRRRQQAASNGRTDDGHVRERRTPPTGQCSAVQRSDDEEEMEGNDADRQRPLVRCS